MAPAPNPGPSAAAIVARGLASVGLWRLLAVAAPHLAALAVMLQTESDFGSRVGFLLSWVILNFFWLALFVAPSGAVGRAVAHPGRGADPAVAAQARHRADDRELRRPDGEGRADFLRPASKQMLICRYNFVRLCARYEFHVLHEGPIRLVSSIPRSEY